MIMSEDHNFAYRDAGLPVDQRVKDLLGRMSLEEKVAQMCCHVRGTAPVDQNGQFSPEEAARLFPHGLGAIGSPGDLGKSPAGYTPRPLQEMEAAPPCSTGAKETAETSNLIQRHFVEQTRWGIPVLFHVELLHGLAAQDGICFPQAIALASAWDPEMVEEIFAVSAAEARSRGLQHAFGPVLDLARDPRWGRTEETWGEDPYLCSRYAVAAVRGAQGEGPVIGPDRVAVTLKHFAAYGQCEGGRNTAPANISERVLRELHLAPFEAAVKEAGAHFVMPAYNEIDGIPCHANRWLLTEVLRDEWGFAGAVVSDYSGIRSLCDPQDGHHVCHSPEEAARRALRAGVDLETPDAFCFPGLVEQVRQGSLDEKVIDLAAGRILRVKFLLGLFERPYADAREAERLCDHPKHRQLALRAAQRSVVLLKNDGPVLPLVRENLRCLAVIGPNAGDCHIGGYAGWPKYAVDLLTGLHNRVGNDLEIVYAEGCRITANRGAREWMSKVEIPPEEENDKRIAEAMAVAVKADVIVVAIGENEELCREGMDMDSLALVGPQEKLIRSLSALGKPVVAVVINGRPLLLQEVELHANAVLEAWYLGQETGHALADVIFGDVNPGGKLPITFPRTTGSIPACYNRKPSTSSYVFGETAPMYPFGFGLSYTTFRYDEIRVVPESIKPGAAARVHVTLTNTGQRAGDEVVQLYIRDLVSSVTRPIKELKGFRRVSLGPGESKTVMFDLGFSALSLLNEEMQRVVEPGEFEVLAGGSSDRTIGATLRVTPVASAR
jgi:beta-glucosidase